MSGFRLPAGGRIDRGVRLEFSFDGQRLEGYAGDTLASALLGAGISLVGRSFKYHRPRGIFTAGAEEPNALVELRTGARREPNTRATTTELYAGLEAASQNRFPSLRFDLGAANSLAAPLLSAGFYYKTFMWPASFWERVYEPLIRRAAGLGRASGAPDPDSYEKANGFCDVLVIGAGPAGLSAALAAGRAGARVVLADEDFLPGGRLNAERFQIDDRPGSEWAAAVVAELAAMANVRLMRRTTVTGVYDGGTYGALERVSDHFAEPPQHQPRQRLWRIVARRAILCSGSLDRPIAFGNNDRPGVMLASAVRTYVNRFAVAPGRRAIVFTASDDGWRTAADLAAAGVEIAAIVDPRAEVAPAVRHLGGGAAVHLEAVLADVGGRAEATSGEIRDRDGRRVRVEADLIAVCGGHNPQIGLATHLGARPAWSEPIAAFVMEAMPPGMVVAGSAAGRFTLEAALRDGSEAGRAAAADTGHAAASSPVPRACDESVAVTPFWHVAASRKKAFVDLQNDVTVRDIELAALEGFGSVEHLKRYTTLGMATDQGKTSNVAGLAILAGFTGREIPGTGTTRARPPHVPVAIGALAGPHRGREFKPTRALAAGAVVSARGRARLARERQPRGEPGPRRRRRLRCLDAW